MNNKCIKLGVIQAFLDGELASDKSERVIHHIAACNDCALMLSETEEENSYAFPLLDRSLDVLVPTERLRTKLFTAIDEIEKRERVTLWQRLSAIVPIFSEINFGSPAFAAVAATVMFVGSFAIALKVFPRLISLDEVAVNEPRDRFEPAPDFERVGGNENAAEGNDNEGNSEDIEDSDDSGVVVVQNVDRPRFQRARYRAPAERKTTPVVRSSTRPVPAAPAVVGEDIYVQTIATLNRNISQTKDEVLEPKERIEFEKNIAMVDNAISKMKDEVRKNPRNNAAKELLKTSYQNKIDLLSSVSEKTELMASLD